MYRYKIRFSVRLLECFQEILTILFREAVAAAQQQDFLRAEATALRLESLFKGPYGYDEAMLTLVRGFLNDLFGYFGDCQEARQTWLENLPTFTPDPWDGEALRVAVQQITPERWLTHREAQNPASAASLCDALSLAAAGRLVEAANVGNKAYRRAYRERNMPVWICTHVFLEALFKGFPRQHPYRRNWYYASDGRRWRPWPNPVLSVALKALMKADTPVYYGLSLPPLPPF